MQIVDGLHEYSSWAHGLAFTGGHQTAAGGEPYGAPAGVRHALIDFGAPRTFQKATIWWQCIDQHPTRGGCGIWNGSVWVSIAPFTREYGTMHAEGTNSGLADSDIYTFPPVTGSKFRYSFDNSGYNILGTYNVHGWIYEVEVWSADAAGSDGGTSGGGGETSGGGGASGGGTTGSGTDPAREERAAGPTPMGEDRPLMRERATAR